MIRGMTRLLILAFSLLAAPAMPRYHNPVFVRDFPDPMVLRLSAHQYYAYGTSVAWTAGYFPVLRSTNLVRWTYVGDAFHQLPHGALGDLWAPDVIHRGHTYYLYYTYLGTIGHCIGAATSSRPSGPFHYRSTIGCGSRGGLGWIDPDPFLAAHHAYLYVAVDSPHRLAVIPLRANLLHAAGAARPILGVSEPWEGGVTVEGPFMIRHDGRYDLFYSGNDWRGSYAMGMASAPSPLGPFTPCACNPVLHGTGKVIGPGGGSVVRGPNGKLWLLYHAWSGPEGYDRGGQRTLRLDPLQWHGNTVTVRPTVGNGSAG